MKAVEWGRFLTEQRARYGKGVFSVTELANVADASPTVINVQLGRLVRQGVIRRWAPGRYGLPEGVTAEELACAIDGDAYVTGGYALARHGLITQQPREIECFTSRRHNRSRRRSTPLGTLVFICVSPRIHARPADGSLAPPEQAFLSFGRQATPRFPRRPPRRIDPPCQRDYNVITRRAFARNMLEPGS